MNATHVNVQKILSQRLLIPKGNSRDPENENLRKSMCRIKEVLSEVLQCQQI